MDDFDLQRIENAIWVLEQYYYEVRRLAQDRDFDSADCNKLFEILREVNLEVKALQK